MKENKSSFKPTLAFFLWTILYTALFCMSCNEVQGTSRNENGSGNLTSNNTDRIADTINKPAEASMTGSVPTGIIIDVHMRAQRSKILYAIWAQYPALSAKQPLYICRTVVQDMQKEKSNTTRSYSKGRLGGRALPYYRTYVANRILWKDLSEADKEEIDAVTGASIQGNHTFSFHIEALARQFQIFFEVDKSWDANDWFRYSPKENGFTYRNTKKHRGNQPAVLFRVDVDLDNPPPDNSYTMVPVGWTPHEKNPAPGILTQDDLFQLSTELRYITNKNDGSGGFGGIDSKRATLLMEDESIKITIRNAK